MSRRTNRRPLRTHHAVGLPDPHTTKPLRAPVAAVYRDPFSGPSGRRPHFTCETCTVSWSGAEADCWNCGQPATDEHPHLVAALQVLLHGHYPSHPATHCA
ncbi:hypothetical protein ACWCYY_34915 [Kitasatospora sp. NPDC001664]